MAQSTIRLAAGAGVVAASLLIVGPYPAAAVADKHGSGPHSRNDDRGNGSNRQSNGSDRQSNGSNRQSNGSNRQSNGSNRQSNGSNRQSNGQKRNGLNWVNDVLDIGGTDKDSIPDLAPPIMDLGTAGSDLENLAIGESIASDGPTALRSAAVAEEPMSGPTALRSAAVAEEPMSGPTALRSAAVAEEPMSGPTALRSADVVDEPPSVNAFGAVPRSASDNSGAPAVPAGSPRVVVGNGRAPGLQDAGTEPAHEYPAHEYPAHEYPVTEVAPAVPVAIEVTIAPLPPPLPPVERIHLPRLVEDELGPGKIDTMTDPLFGLAGLLLIPAVGAALGYRQARAAQSLRESTRL